MAFTVREKLKYRFEQYLNKGGLAIFTSLFLVFMVLFLLIIGIRLLLVWVAPEFAHPDRESFWDDIWVIWLQLTDPGNMGEDSQSPTWLKITTILSGIVGVIILSMLIAFITTALENVFYNFRKGRGKVIEEGHTVILGWNERVVDIVRELIIANESKKHTCVVILSVHEKDEMDDLLTKRITNTKTTTIITTTGDYANINELNRINVASAKSVIILANCSENSGEREKTESDMQSIKSIMAIGSCQGGHNEVPIIAEIFAEEKRKLISLFKDNKIIMVDSWDIMGKLLVQTSMTSGLDVVYNEMLSFNGCEIYFFELDWNGISFGQLPYHFKDGIPLGIYNKEDGMVLRPPKNYTRKPGDQIVLLAQDDSSIKLERPALCTPKDLDFSETKLEKKNKRVLILGWHSVAEIFIKESSDYLTSGTQVDILYKSPAQELLDKLENLRKRYPDFKIDLIDSDPLKLENLEAVSPFNYDNVIILSQNVHEQRVDKIDSETLIILLLLRHVKEKSSGNGKTKIITQVLNSENQDIINQTDVDDFIISNKLITMILAQLSEQPLINKVYESLFSEEGSEIYIKPASLYFASFPQKIRFADLIGQVAKRDEICLGIRETDKKYDPGSNFGVTLNLPKNELIEISESDHIVVLSEDEL